MGQAFSLSQYQEDLGHLKMTCNKYYEKEHPNKNRLLPLAFRVTRFVKLYAGYLIEIDVL